MTIKSTAPEIKYFNPASLVYYNSRAEMAMDLDARLSWFHHEKPGWKITIDGTRIFGMEVYVNNEYEDPDNPNEVEFGSQRLDFGIARHLSLVSYVASVWSIYDRVSNACGRLAAISEIAENPRQNPKACEDLIGKKDTHGFSVQFHIREAYAWPLRVSYKVRNWLLHEGWEENSIPLFRGDSIGDGLLLHDDAARHLEKCSGYSTDGGKISGCCLSSSEECWPTSDLLLILPNYHAELDALFSGLLKWSVDSFVGKIEAFTARDRP